MLCYYIDTFGIEKLVFDTVPLVFILFILLHIRMYLMKFYHVIKIHIFVLY